MDSIHSILKKNWGFDAFRPLQEEIIQSVMSGADTLALLPTGGGKSLCFQVPALALPGICVVVSPLIALMKDQVYNLERRQIKAAAVYTGMSYREMDITLDNCVYGDHKFLYVSPERLETDLFKARVEKMVVNLVAVDEAHCISQWGYDFRPAYLNIVQIRTIVPDVPVLALTASATARVQQDIQDKLAFSQGKVFRKSFARENLSYSVFLSDDKLRRLHEILSKVPGTSILYVRNRKRTEEIARRLKKLGLAASFYHAGLEPKIRTGRQEDWINGKTRVMVCTNAFGMGIDKPDVRTVIHLDLPDSLEAYYQEAGRAGRDGQRAYAVILFDRKDVDGLRNNLDQRYPHLSSIQATYKALVNYLQVPAGQGEFKSFNFELEEFCHTFKLPLLETHYALKAMEQQGYISISEAGWSFPKVKIIATRELLYDIELKYPQLDPVIKFILRTYEGAFNQFVRIQERQIAKKLEIDPAEIRNRLFRLQKLGVLYYEPMKDKPQLTFLMARQAPGAIKKDMKALKIRKQVSKDQVEAIIKYAENEHRCRSRQLLAYFGELHAEPCGICDICLGRKRTGLTVKRFEEITKKITQEIKGKDLTIKELAEALPGYNKNAVGEVIRWMTDQGLLQRSASNTLIWKN